MRLREPVGGVGRGQGGLFPSRVSIGYSPHNDEPHRKDPSHMPPPNKLSGHDIDGRADRYALAGTAFQLLTGAPPSALRELQPGGGHQRPPHRATPSSARSAPISHAWTGAGHRLGQDGCRTLCELRAVRRSLPPSGGQRLDQRPTHPGRQPPGSPCPSSPPPIPAETVGVEGRLLCGRGLFGCRRPQLLVGLQGVA